jgi:hypothetical protein
VTADERAIIDAALAHRPATESVLRWACYNGDCEDPAHGAAGECPYVEVIVCAACHALSMEINDEMIPDEVRADRCPVCVAVTAHLAVQS